MRKMSEEAVGRGNITAGTRMIGLTVDGTVGAVCRENPGYFAVGTTAAENLLIRHHA